MRQHTTQECFDPAGTFKLKLCRTSTGGHCQGISTVSQGLWAQTQPLESTPDRTVKTESRISKVTYDRLVFAQMQDKLHHCKQFSRNAHLRQKYR